MNAKTNRLQEVLQLRKSIHELEQSKARTEGSLEQSMCMLQKDFKVTSIDKAKQLLAKMDATLAKKNRTFETKLERFKRRWKKYL
ncbi:MAG: hypothetical protein JRC90_10665 [Deltaproteobacteria bacterium]|nr:hypothetical protein [Deltaproteobacteria bacterium]